MADLKPIAEKIAKFTPEEAQELQDILRDDYGIKPLSDDIPDWAKEGFVPEDEEPQEAQTEFDVVLQGAGASKLKVVKAVNQLLGKGLREAKAVVDAAPTPIKEAISEVEAQSIKALLEAEGATVTIV